MNKSMLKALPLLAIALVSTACQKNTVTTFHNWHPSIDNKIQSLAEGQVLNFGTLVKNDGKYCYVSYEGDLRSAEILKNTSGTLQEIINEIDNVLKNEFAQTTLDLTKSANVTNMENLSQEHKNYLQKKSELECIRELSVRQIAKYQKRLEDNRLSAR